MKKIFNEFLEVLKWVLYLVIAMFLIIATISIVGEVVIYFIKKPILGIN